MAAGQRSTRKALAGKRMRFQLHKENNNRENDQVRKQSVLRLLFGRVQLPFSLGVKGHGISFSSVRPLRYGSGGVGGGANVDVADVDGVLF